MRPKLLRQTSWHGVLLARHDETACLAVVDGGESVYIALEETSQPVRLVTHVGSRTPSFASASGRVILAARPPEAVTAVAWLPAWNGVRAEPSIAASP